MIWAVVIIAIAVIVLTALVDFGVIKKARHIKLAGLGKVALIALKEALADGKITKEEFFDGVQKVLDEARKE